MNVMIKTCLTLAIAAFGFLAVLSDAHAQSTPCPAPVVHAAWPLYGTTSNSYIYPGGYGQPPRNICASGYTPTTLVDDNDGSHNINEDHAGVVGGDRAQLCLGTSVPDVQFTSVWASQTCPAGMLDTGVYDTDCNDLYEHKTFEEDGGSCRYRWCLGLTGAQSQHYDLRVDRVYSRSCPSGWTHIVGTHDEKWNINQEDGSINRALCLKIDAKSSAPQSCGSTPPPPPPVNEPPAAPICYSSPECGTSAGQSFSTMPTGNLCLNGAAGAITESGTEYSWTCSDGTASSPTCRATRVTSVTCTPNAAYTWNGSSWQNEGTPNWAIPNWSSGPWWGSQVGQELTVYDNDNVPMTGVIAVSPMKMQCGGATATINWQTGNWSGCDCQGLRTRSVTCQGSDGASYPESYCTATKPRTSEDCTDLPPQCVIPEAGVCGASHNQSFMNAPQGDLCDKGNSSSVTENAGIFRWSCSGVNGGTTRQCQAMKGCPTGQVMVSGTTVVSAGINWNRWSTGQPLCPAGQVYGLIDDDADNRHSASEEGSNLTPQMRMCITNVPAEVGLEFRWNYTGGIKGESSCPSGWEFAGLYDDNDAHHHTEEQDGCTGNCHSHSWCARATNPAYTVTIDRKKSCGSGEVTLLRIDSSDDDMHSDEDDDERSYCLKITTQTQYCAAVGYGGGLGENCAGLSGIAALRCYLQ